jgi:hypothetical protein
MMGKRSTFERRAQDAYDTPPEAVLPLLPHLPDERLRIWEPCAGKGNLREALQWIHGRADEWFMTDVEPRDDGIWARNALAVSYNDILNEWCVDLIITNPPWTRSILHPMIEHFSDMRPTWLLFDADWMHTKQSAPYMHLCRKIVSVGRVKWIPDSPHTGKDNVCWYLFDARNTGPTEFVGRSHA